MELGLILLCFETVFPCSVGACPGIWSVAQPRLNLNSQSSVCLYLPSAGINSVCHHCPARFKVLHHIYLFVCVYIHVPWCMYGGQRTTCQLAPPPSGFWGLNSVVRLGSKLPLPSEPHHWDF